MELLINLFQSNYLFIPNKYYCKKFIGLYIPTLKSTLEYYFPIKQSYMHTLWFWQDKAHPQVPCLLGRVYVDNSYSPL